MIFKSDTMHLHIKNAVGFLTFPALEKYDFVRHAFSTRLGGVSKDEFTSMNLSFNRGDSDENVHENYRRICKAVGCTYEGLVASAQDHHTNIRRVTAQDKGIGIWRPRDMQSVDGLLTNEAGITLVTYYADCVPLFFLDPIKKVIGLAHAGWRGTVAGIGAKMISRMEEEFGCNAKDIIAAVGPSIGPCCYEVDEPVAQQFLALKNLQPEQFVIGKGEGKYMLDLWETNRRVLLSAGVAREHIFVTDLCTCCKQDLLISHRATGGKRGGMAALMTLTEAAGESHE